MEARAGNSAAMTDRPIEPSQTLSGKSKDNGETEIRKGGVERGKPDEKTGMPGKVDIDRTKGKIKDMAGGKAGTVVTLTRERRARRTQAEISAQAAMRLLELDSNEERSKLITMNLLKKSGLRGNRPERDANMIQDSIYEAAHQLRNDRLKDALDRHFNLNYLDDKAREDQADGCTIAALLMMNAAMLHQRISAGRWLDGVESLDVIKNSNNPVSEIKDQWNTIRARDFPRPVIEPALEAIRAVEAYRQDRRTGQGCPPHSQGGRGTGRQLCRPRRGPRRPPVQPRHGQPSQRRRLFHSARGRLRRRLASPWTPWESRTGPTRRRGRSTRPWTWPAAAARSSPQC